MDKLKSVNIIGKFNRIKNRGTIIKDLLIK